MPQDSPRKNLEQRFEKRRKTVLSQIKNSIMVIPSGDEKPISRDQNYNFVPDSDFFYLTGFKETKCILVLKGIGSPKSILYLRDRDLVEEKWLGERIGIKRARRRFKLDDIRPYANFKNDFPALTEKSEKIYYALGSSKETDEIIISNLTTRNGPRYNYPNELLDSRLITSEMRLVKDKDEINAISRASEITARSMLEICKYLPDFKSEKHAASELETLFTKHGAHGLAFSTIVAAGKNSTTLHHLPNHSPIWKRDLVLIDAGAQFNNYCGDITRVFPISGKFSTVQAEVYDIVREALGEALLSAKAGNCLDDIHNIAVKELTKGLVSIKAISSNSTVSQIISKGEYKNYYMHNTGHWLGIDVHDISPTHYQGLQVPSRLRPFEPGHVFTIEPGLYFDPSDTSISPELRGIGIRLEEDVLITPKGNQVLSSGVPLDRKEVENLMNR